MMSDWFLEHDDELVVLQWPLQTLDLQKNTIRGTGGCHLSMGYDL